MIEYAAPLEDMLFLLRELMAAQLLLEPSPLRQLEWDTLTQILEQAGTFAAEVLSPLNKIGDREGCRLEQGGVRTPSGWREAYQRFTADGWNTVGCPSHLGGQGLPTVIAALVEEMWHAANPAFALCPMLTRSVIDALDTAASQAIKDRYIRELVGGRWTATMTMTEPQAGSDLAAVKTLAIPRADGSYGLTGQKIFITYGEHDLTKNILHLVLARTPTAPAGVKGLSLFVVPRLIQTADGGEAMSNHVRCLSIEHKLGIHGSPTCVLQFGGDRGGAATGWLVGEENRGLEYMFVTMNAARLSIGIQGLGIAERAYQQALRYAKERKQGTDSPDGQSVPIIHHADVRRMVLTMKSLTEAMRALVCAVAEAVDRSHCHPEEPVRQRADAFVSLMTPVIKGWFTECAVEIASLNIQVHGGMGYIEESGAPQLLRDARITPIYEGTTGIQANDLVNRKIVRDRGQTAAELIATMRQECAQLSCSASDSLRAFGQWLVEAIDQLAQAVSQVIANGRAEPGRALATAQPLLLLFGVVTGGWQLARSAMAAERRLNADQVSRRFGEAKILTACFYGDYILPRAAALKHTVVRGGQATEMFAADRL
jgi:alkylation response protein AidB-like acyl-CoA dehydrogenase